ncbi:MAG: hypothetical protein M3Q05_12755 [Bacteroidota bacterium]|nr:hypothetical protein [Bacteroidota bacterium]
MRFLRIPEVEDDRVEPSKTRNAQTIKTNRCARELTLIMFQSGTLGNAWGGSSVKIKINAAQPKAGK